MFRIVREVRIHLEDQIGAGFQRMLQSIDIGTSEAARSRPVKHRDASRMLSRELAGGENRDVLPFVVGGNDDDDVPARGHAASPRANAADAAMTRTGSSTGIRN